MTPQSPARRAWRPHWTLPRILAGAFALLIVGLALLIAFFDWNRLKPFVERQASDALGRPVTMASFDVSLGRASWIEMHDIKVANAEGFQGGDLATVERVAVQIETFPLLVGRIVIPEIAVLRPKGRFETDPAGKNNYAFDLGKDDNGDGGLNIELGHLTIDEADFRYIDAPKKTDLRIKAQTDQQGDKKALVRAVGEGRYNGEPAKLNFQGGALLMFRDPGVSYPVDIDIAIGPTRGKIHGTIEQPLDFKGANLQLDIAGESMSDLYPLIGLPIPVTPPFTLKGGLDFAGKVVVFKAFAGTVGNSDLAGDFAVNLAGARPKMSGYLTSDKVVLADLAGFIGAPPGKEDDPKSLTPERRELERQAEASGRLLPTEPIALDKLREFDVDVVYRGKRIESDYTPLDRLTAFLKIDDGYLTLQPLAFGIGDGAIEMQVKLDGRQTSPATDFVAEFKDVDLKRIMQETELFQGVGRIAGNTRIQTTGRSISEMLGRGDGELQLFMEGGTFSKLLLELVGLDATEALGFVFGGQDLQAELRCLVADMKLQKGILTPETLLLDTSDTNINVTGGINLRDETLDLRIVPAPKDMSILTARGPIIVDGPMRDPGIQPEAANIAGRTTAAVLLGIFLTPLAAIIPTIELGLGEDSDCGGLIAEVRDRAAERNMPISVPTKPAAPPPVPPTK
ncbi:MAG: AsmA family protein [Alphaproteobacteria bacterium]